MAGNYQQPTNLGRVSRSCSNLAGDPYVQNHKTVNGGFTRSTNEVMDYCGQNSTTKSRNSKSSSGVQKPVSTGAIKKKTIGKTVHRNIEVPARCGVVHPHNAFGAQCYCCENNTCCVQEESPMLEPYVEPITADLREPQLNSALRNIVDIEEFKNLNLQPPKSVDISPRTKALIAPKINAKMNFNSGRTVFKNLIPLNVNDSIMEQQKPKRKEYVNPVKKIPVPELRDFLEKIPKSVCPPPEITMPEQEFLHTRFDFLQSYIDCYEPNYC